MRQPAMTGGEIQVNTTQSMQLLDLTTQIEKVIAEAGIQNGLCFLYNPHTTAGVIINEGADPDVRRDLIGALERMLPRNYPYTHAEGNSPSHMLAALTGSSVTVFIEQGRLRLGTWQRIFFCEFDGPRSRTLWWKGLAC